MEYKENICFNSENLLTFTEKGFQPILKTYCGVLDKHELQPVETLRGQSLKELREGVDLPFFKGFFKPYSFEKAEKITLCNFILMDKILLTAVVGIPDDNHDFPMLILEWSETDKIIAIVADLVPMVDLVMREDYREKYLDPLDKYWEKNKKLPGMEYNRFVWARQMLSPYYLAGMIPKDNEQNIQACLDLFRNYLEVWMNIVRESGPVENDDLKKYISERKAVIRKNFREKDEGAKSLAKMIGDDLQELSAHCLF